MELSSSAGVDNCPNGYFRNASEKIGNNCTACPPSSKCLNLTHITECKNARDLANAHHGNVATIATAATAKKDPPSRSEET